MTISAFQQEVVRRIEEMPLDQQVEQFKLAAGANFEALAAERKAHHDLVGDLYGQIRRLKKELRERDERIDSTVVWTGTTQYGKYVTLRMLVEDFEGRYTHVKCDTCDELGCDGDSCR